jgi:hypothetical protein
MRINVFGHRENPAKDRPCMRVSKSAAEKWLSLGTHFRLNKYSIQALDPAYVGKRTDVEKGITYIPEHLPPVEVPQVRFREPATEQWMKEHRAVNRFWAAQ